MNVVDRDLAERRWLEVVRPVTLGSEVAALAQSLGRVLAVDVVSAVDVPAFDRSNVDGFAVRAEDTFGASEEGPRRLRIMGDELAPGVVCVDPVTPGSGRPIATGAVVPRGADAIVMVEHAVTTRDGRVLVMKPVAPGAGVTFAGTDIARGELVLRKGTRLWVDVDRL